MGKLAIVSMGAAQIPILLKDTEDGIKTAAGELAHYLQRVSGAVFTVKTDEGEKGIRLILDASLDEEQFRIQTESKGLTISGGSVRGVFYGVYGLLEDVLGLKFYTHDVTVVPQIPELSLDDLDLTDKPALEYRQLDNPLSMFPEWRARKARRYPLHCPSFRSA